MSFKQLYNDDERYLPDAVELNRQTIVALRPLLMEYRAKGYSVRELAGLMQRAITDVELELIL